MTSRPAPRLALCYDFDGTLCPGNLPEYASIKELGMEPGQFWEEVRDITLGTNADYILMFMQYFLEKTLARGIEPTAGFFAQCAKGLPLFNGLETWFGRMKDFGAEKGLKVEHYLVSSGLEEMIGGVELAGQFDRIFASAYAYDGQGRAVWPRLAINHTAKTQFLFRINKDAPEAKDNNLSDGFIPHRDRPIPFNRMVFIGDGTTDIPAMKLVKEQGGHAIAVYEPGSAELKKQAAGLLDQGRVNLVAPADYGPGGLLEDQVKAIIRKAASDLRVERLIRNSESENGR